MGKDAEMIRICAMLLLPVSIIFSGAWVQDADQPSRHDDLYAWLGDMDVAAQIAPGARIVLPEEVERIHICNRLLEDHVGPNTSRIYMILVSGSHGANTVDMIPSRFLAGIHDVEADTVRMPKYICGQHRGRPALGYNDGSIPIRWVQQE